MPIDVLGLAGIGKELVGKIPTGKGKRKMSARYLDAEADNLEVLIADLDAAANSGEVLSGFALKMVNARLKTTVAVMRTTVNAIGPDDIVDND